MRYNTTTFMNPNLVTCPNCNHKFLPNEAERHEIEERANKEATEKLEREREDDRKKMLAWQEEQKKKMLTENDLELKALKDESDRKDQALKRSREKELEYLKEKKILQEKAESLDLEIARQVDEQRKKIREEEQVLMSEKYHLREKDYEQKIEAMKKSLEEAQRKASQGSQQLQGEVMELELEEMLKREFPHDQILPVPKGVNGADIIQKVNEVSGRFCGVVIWESKRTKNWTEGWVAKLKEDMRAVGADQAILVTMVLPAGVKNFIYKDGIYITNFENAINLARIVRIILAEISLTKASVVGTNYKMESLYNYISSSEFRQKVEAMLEACKAMKTTLEKEKMQMNKNWAQREKEIETIVSSTVKIHGSLTGIIGSALPEIGIFEEITLVEVGEDDNQTI